MQEHKECPFNNVNNLYASLFSFKLNYIKMKSKTQGAILFTDRPYNPTITNNVLIDRRLFVKVSLDRSVWWCWWWGRRRKVDIML